jgi:hypothetical protein
MPQMDGRHPPLSLARIARSASLSARLVCVSQCSLHRFLPASSCPSPHPAPPCCRWSLATSRPSFAASSASRFPSGPICLIRLHRAAFLLAGGLLVAIPPPCRRAFTTDACKQVRGTTICVTSPLTTSCPCRCCIARSMRHRQPPRATCLHSSKQSPHCKSMIQVF